MTENNPVPPVQEPSCAPGGGTSKELLRQTRRTYSRCGWATFALTILLTLFSVALTLILNSPFAKKHSLDTFLGDNILYLNELIVGIAILLAMLLLLGMPKAPPERRALSPGLFLLLFAVAVAMNFVGNLRSGLVNSVWESFTAISQEDDLSLVMDALDPLQMTLCAGILAPFIEEFFFRKLLIDRLYAHGPLTAILFSSVAFSLFHGNFDQLYYTLGVGLLLGYLYCQTGSYLSVVFLHMALNIFSGVIPVLLVSEIPLDALFSETLILSEILPTLFSLFYIHINLSVVAIGVTLFFLYLKRIKVAPRETALTRTDHTSAVLLNGGVITAAVISLILLFLSLFAG